MILLGGGVLLAAGGGSMLAPRPQPAPFHLLVVTEPDGPSTREWIVQARPDGGNPTILTGDFWTAGSVSLSFDARRFLFSGKRSPDGERGIWEMEIGGSEPRWITGGNGDPDHPAYLPDGRILFRDAPSPEDSGPQGPRSLFSCRPDGTDAVRITYGSFRDGRPEVLADGRVRFERAPVARGDPAGPVPMAVHPDGTGPTHHTGEAAGSPPEEWVIVTIGMKDFLVREEHAGVARAVPPVLTSVVDRRKSAGTLLCLDVYESRLPSVSRLAPGTVDRVRLTRAGTPRGGGGGGGEVLAEARVHPDGSFFVEVPADTALRLDLLAGNGEIVASQTHPLWVRPNENRGCIGCHENPHLAPPNRLPLALAASRSGGGGDAE